MQPHSLAWLPAGKRLFLEGDTFTWTDGV